MARYRLSLVREPNPHYQDPQRCDSPEAAVQAIRPLVENEPYEVMGALMLDTRHRAIGYEIAYRGTLNRAAVEPRDPGRPFARVVDAKHAFGRKDLHTSHFATCPHAGRWRRRTTRRLP